MTLRLYLDHNIQRQIASGLRLCSVEVLTAYEDTMHEADDSDVLERAGKLHYTLVTKDHDFLKIASEKLQQQIEFAGIIYIAKDDLPIGQCIEELELAAKVFEPEEIFSRVLYLPL